MTHKESGFSVNYLHIRCLMFLSSNLFTSHTARQPTHRLAAVSAKTEIFNMVRL